MHTDPSHVVKKGSFIMSQESAENKDKDVVSEELLADIRQSDSSGSLSDKQEVDKETTKNAPPSSHSASQSKYRSTSPKSRQGSA